MVWVSLDPTMFNYAEWLCGLNFAFNERSGMTAHGAEQKYRWEITYIRFGVESRPSAETQI
jgi:hypothetical protein